VRKKEGARGGGGAHDGLKGRRLRNRRFSRGGTAKAKVSIERHGEGQLYESVSVIANENLKLREP